MTGEFLFLSFSHTLASGLRPSIVGLVNGHWSGTSAWGDDAPEDVW